MAPPTAVSPRFKMLEFNLITDLGIEVKAIVSTARGVPARMDDKEDSPAPSPNAERVLPESRRRSLRLYKAGLSLLGENKIADATKAFAEAAEIEPDNPVLLSYLGLTLAMDRGRGREGLELCERAVKLDAYRVELFHNLGRVYLLSGRRKKALLAFSRGKALDRQHHPIQDELQGMGIRRGPVFSFLPRGHAANRIAGRTLSRLGLR